MSALDSPPVIAPSPNAWRWEESTRLESTVRGLDYCIDRATTPEGVTLGSVMDHLGAASFCFLGLLLAAPFIQPISLGPLTMASGGVFMLVGWQMARGRPHVELPDRVKAWHLRGKTWIGILNLCRKMIVGLSRFTRPRMSAWVDGERGSRHVGWLIFVGGGLLTVPCANLPFNNTLPALMIFFAAVAWLERDGLMAVISMAWGILTLCYFAAAAWVLLWVGTGVFNWIQG